MEKKLTKTSVPIYGLDDFPDLFNLFAKFRPGLNVELAMSQY